MEGFFTKKETTSNTRPDGRTYSCVSCGLYKGCNTPKMKVQGGFNKGILNIGTIPTKTEDRHGKPFQNKSYQLLEKVYKELGIDLHKDCLNMYAIHCMSEDNPTTYHVDCCRKTTMKVIKKYKPKIIVLFGFEATYSVIGNRWKKDFGNKEKNSWSKWRGWSIPDQDLECWVIPTFDPYQILNSKNPVEEVIWKQDLQKVFKHIDTPLRKYPEPEIIYLEDDLSVFNKLSNGSMIAFDYETTGLKPHAKDHRIVCASVAISEDKVYTFMMPKSKNKRKPFTDMLQSEHVMKIAQNIKFEDNWTNVRLRVPVKRWVHDTMLATHMIDNRTGVTGLKFQAYVQFGIINYDDEVASLLKSVENKNANSLNRIHELIETVEGEKTLLKYCALDSIYVYRLAKLQWKIHGTQGLTDLSPSLSDYPNAYHLLHDGILAFAKAERQGLRIDTDYTERKKKRLTKKINILEKKFFDSKFYRHWQHTTKNKINLNSGDQLGKFLYGVKKINPTKFTETGKGSTDEEALKMLNIPELNWLLERGKLKTLIDKLNGFNTEQVKGIIHPFFNLHLARTYRSSSNNPNFQNIHKRDKVSMRTIRQAIYPRSGNQLLEEDFSGIEVSIAACYHKDKNMIKYLESGEDFHGLITKQIFKINNFDKSRTDPKYLRDCIKNSFVFPQFYGDYYKNCAMNICTVWMELPQSEWKKGMGYEMNDKTTIGDHLISKGFNSYNEFMEHIRLIEKDFWKNRFPQYARWKERWYKEYLKNGYVPLKTGFTCGGVMKKNDVINYPIQGSAFHCLLWTFIEVTNRLEERKLNSKIVGQIHDSLIIDVVPNELYEVHELVQHIGTVMLPKKFKWINVPLKIEAELSPIDGSWADKEDWKPNDDLPF